MRVQTGPLARRRICGAPTFKATRRTAALPGKGRSSRYVIRLLLAGHRMKTEGSPHAELVLAMAKRLVLRLCPAETRAFLATLHPDGNMSPSRDLLRACSPVEEVCTATLPGVRCTHGARPIGLRGRAR